MRAYVICLSAILDTSRACYPEGRLPRNMGTAEIATQNMMHGCLSSLLTLTCVGESFLLLDAAKAQCQATQSIRSYERDEWFHDVHLLEDNETMEDADGKPVHAEPRQGIQPIKAPLHPPAHIPGLGHQSCALTDFVTVILCG